MPVNQVRPIKKEIKKPEEKNNLEVVDYRRRKSIEHKREKIAEKHKTGHEKSNGTIKKDLKLTSHDKSLEKRQEDGHKKHKSLSSGKKAIDATTGKLLERDDRKEKKNSNDQDKKDIQKKYTEPKTRRTSGSDKKLVKSVAICDETDAHLKDKKSANDSREKIKGDVIKRKLLSPNVTQHMHFSTKNSVIVKPPNIFVYADSLVAKENVKAALASILNRDK